VVFDAKEHNRKATTIGVHLCAATVALLSIEPLGSRIVGGKWGESLNDFRMGADLCEEATPASYQEGVDQVLALNGRPQHGFADGTQRNGALEEVRWDRDQRRRIR
jgi:hypothetical protein